MCHMIKGCQDALLARQEGLRGSDAMVGKLVWRGGADSISQGNWGAVRMSRGELGGHGMWTRCSTYVSANGCAASGWAGGSPGRSITHGTARTGPARPMAWGAAGLAGSHQVGTCREQGGRRPPPRRSYADVKPRTPAVVLLRLSSI
jgi:hypothetical protein